MIHDKEEICSIKSSNTFEDEWNLWDDSILQCSAKIIKDFSSNISQNILITKKGKVKDFDYFRREMNLMAENKSWVEGTNWIYTLYYA